MPLDKTIEELVDLFLDEDLDEISTTAGIPGYNSPYAFTGGKKKYEKMRKKIARAGGYKLKKRKRNQFFTVQNIKRQKLWENQ